MNYLEHVNITVSNPNEIAHILCKLFDWQIRWSGSAMNGGYSVHVGQGKKGDSYIALYAPIKMRKSNLNQSDLELNLNHIAVKVGDIELTEKRAIDQNLKPYNYGDYQPGRRFYLDLPGKLELEVVSYSES